MGLVRWLEKGTCEMMEWDWIAHMLVSVTARWKVVVTECMVSEMDGMVLERTYAVLLAELDVSSRHGG